MEEEIKTTIEQELMPTQASSLALNTDALNQESATIINKLIAEQDVQKTKDLTYLFNINQNKKTMVRQNKLNELQDILVDEAIDRFSSRPAEISNQELMTGLKTVQDMIEKSQKAVNGVTEATPIITINQQNNEINVAGEDSDKKKLTKESRDRVKQAMAAIMASLGQPTTKLEQPIEAEVIDENTLGEDDNG